MKSKCAVFKKPLSARAVSISSKSGQNGATLVIALIILLVMSMIGIANMKSSTMQERMAANTHQKTLAKYAAESALREAESWLSSNVQSTSDLNLFNNSTVGYFSAVRISTSGDAYLRESVISDITDSDLWKEKIPAKSDDIVDADQVSRQPNYIIEYLGRTSVASYSEQLNWEAASEVRSNNDPHLFRITAIGWGKDENIYTVIESSYATGSGHFFQY